jgi:hypothetical protein
LHVSRLFLDASASEPFFTAECAVSTPTLAGTQRLTTSSMLLRMIGRAASNGTSS